MRWGGLPTSRLWCSDDLMVTYVIYCGGRLSNRRLNFFFTQSIHFVILSLAMLIDAKKA
jgi:hypothetical protein